MRKLLLFVLPALFSSPIVAQESLPRYSIIQEGRFQTRQPYDSTLQWYGVYLFQEPDTSWSWNTYLSDSSCNQLRVKYYYVIQPVNITVTREPFYWDSLKQRPDTIFDSFIYSTNEKLSSCFLVGSNTELCFPGHKIFHGSKSAPYIFENLSAGESIYWEMEELLPRLGNPYGNIQTTGSAKLTPTGIKSRKYKMYYDVSYMHSYNPIDLEKSLNKNREKDQPEYHITDETYVVWMGRLNADNHPDLILSDTEHFYLWMTNYVRKTSGSKIFEDGTIYYNMEISNPIIIPKSRYAPSGFEF